MATIGESVRENREDIPLKTGRKGSRLCSWDEDFFSGSKFINISFALLSLIITIALLVQIYYGDYQVVPHGSVATDSRECSAIGTSILKKGGNAVDATIASALCLAVVNPHVTGLDASGQVLVYNHRTRLPPLVIDFYNKEFSSKSLPRLVIGLLNLHKKYGKLPWDLLVEPAASIAQNGFLVSNNLALSIANTKTNLFGDSIQAGQKLQLPKLSSYLQKMGNTSLTDLYQYVNSLNISLESITTVTQFKDYNIYVPANSKIVLPLFSNLQQINSTNVNASDTIKPQYILKLVEITKRTYSQLKVSSNYYKGTSSNIAVMDLNDNYVSLIMGMTTPFGIGRMNSDGYLLDKVVSNKSPSRLPAIIVDSDFVCGKRIVLGITDVATASQVILSLLLPNANATSSIEAPRFNILDDNAIGIEEVHLPTFSQDVLSALKSYSNGSVVTLKEPYSSYNVVEKYAEELNSHSDSRGGGISSRF